MRPRCFIVCTQRKACALQLGERAQWIKRSDFLGCVFNNLCLAQLDRLDLWKMTNKQPFSKK